MIKLTREQWLDVSCKFQWLRLRGNIPAIQLEIIEKWLNDKTEGWWYMDKENSDTFLYVFALDTDMMQFKIWASDRPFENDSGET